MPFPPNSKTDHQFTQTTFYVKKIKPILKRERENVSKQSRAESKGEHYEKKSL